MFLSKSSLYNILSSNKSYFRRFNSLDMKARKINSLKDYYLIIWEACTTFERRDVKKIKKASQMVDDILYQIGNEIEGFDGMKASRMRWKIGCIRGRRYEGGYPHTVKNTVVIPKNLMTNISMKKLVRILLHEKIHIYQRKYKKDMKRYLTSNGFILVKNHKKMRANPDTDGKTYRKGQTIYQCLYRSSNPSKIDDAGAETELEHPYEEFAYQIEEYVKLVF